MHAEILAAAERLLLETGDESAVSIRAVADAVGVTPPSIYLHFADKNELVFAVCEKHFARFEEAARQAIDGVTDPMERVHRRGEAYIRFGLDNPEHYRIMFMSRADTAPPRIDAGLASSAAFEGLVGDVQECMERGEFAPGDPFVVSCGLWATVHGITSLLIAKPHFQWPPVEDLMQVTMVACSRGLAAAGPARAS